jgi:hypothetical protein
MKDSGTGRGASTFISCMPTRHYECGDTLAGEEPLPQLRLRVSALFE